jgi:hypothetical protein
MFADIAVKHCAVFVSRLLMGCAGACAVRGLCAHHAAPHYIPADKAIQLKPFPHYMLADSAAGWSAAFMFRSC